MDEAVNSVENHPFRLLTGMIANTGKIAELHLMIEDILEMLQYLNM